MATKITRHYTTGFFLVVLCQSQEFYKTPVNDIKHLKEKIREAVASLSPSNIVATWR